MMDYWKNLDLLIFFLIQFYMWKCRCDVFMCVACHCLSLNCFQAILYGIMRTWITKNDGKKRERILVYTCLWVKGFWVLCSLFCSAWKEKRLLLRILHEKQFSKLVSLIRCNLNWFKLSYMAFKDRNWDLFWLCIDSISLGLIAYHDRTQWQGGYFT